MLRALLPLLAVFVFVSPALGAGQPERLTWDELHQLIGKQVSIPLYKGCAVSGKVVGVQTDALIIDVSKSSHLQACPKGSLRVPRATLYVLDVNKKGIRYRVTDTTLDVLAAVGVSGNSPQPPRTTTIHIVR